MFIVKPSSEYLGYIDFKVLSQLFCLMTAVSCLTDCGLFYRLSFMITQKIKSKAVISALLIFSCFFLSMWITNDVSLITFVPFTILILSTADGRSYLIFTIIMETAAANLGSMCTPIGNPQNLLIYSISNMSIGSFISTMFPITIISFLIIFCFTIAVLYVKHLKNFKVKYDSHGILTTVPQDMAIPSKIKLWPSSLFILLFIISLLSVLRIADYRAVLAIVTLTVLIVRPSVFKKTDYSLLFTFIAFFIFVGNIKHMEMISSFLLNNLKGNEIVISIIASQLISNVPAAVLLSGFTENYRAIMLGTDVGGLGTLIASMASLISYKIYVSDAGSNKLCYIIYFTIINFLLLAMLFIALILMHAV
jgi:Na+/H+ antiporter NhaD/arsenite permease-like protein